MTRILTASDILTAADMPPPERVEVPEWGGAVFVRTLTAGERDRLEKAILDARPQEDKNKDKDKNEEADKRRQTIVPPNFRGLLVSLAACDEQGKRLFTDADVAKLSDKSAAAMSRVFDVALRLSGFTDADVEELQKNSSTTPDACSASA